MNTIYQKTIETCKKFLDDTDEQNDKLIIVLGKCRDWLETVRSKTKGNQNIILISDTEEFTAFIQKNGCSKMYININLLDKNGIDLAKELGLRAHFAELFFVAEEMPMAKDLGRIDSLGGQFVLKREVLDKIIYPKGD